jgi:hypothetical protein
VEKGMISQREMLCPAEGLSHSQLILLQAETRLGI